MARVMASAAGAGEDAAFPDAGESATPAVTLFLNFAAEILAPACDSRRTRAKRDDFDGGGGGVLPFGGGGGAFPFGPFDPFGPSGPFGAFNPCGAGGGAFPFGGGGGEPLPLGDAFALPLFGGGGGGFFVIADLSP